MSGFLVLPLATLQCQVDSAVALSSLHRKRQDAVGVSAAVNPPAPDNLEHATAGQSADRSARRLSIHTPSPSHVVERSSGGPVALGVAIQNDPDHQLARLRSAMTLSTKAFRSSKRRRDSRLEVLLGSRHVGATSNGSVNWNKIIVRSFSGATGLKSRCLPPTAARMDAWAGFHIQEVAVKAPRFRIGWLMVAVAIAALDFAAISAGFRKNPGGFDFLVLGALPMANVLAVGILIGRQRPESRPFLLGFEAFGAVALVLYFAFVCLSPDLEGPLHRYLAVTVGPLIMLVEQNYPSLLHLISLIGIAAMLGWPQVAVALLGGFLFRRFKITITRR